MYQLLTAPAAVSLTRVLAHMERDEVVAQARLAGIKGLVALLQVACGVFIVQPSPPVADHTFCSTISGGF